MFPVAIGVGFSNIRIIQKIYRFAILIILMLDGTEVTLTKPSPPSPSVPSTDTQRLAEPQPGIVDKQPDQVRSSVPSTVSHVTTKSTTLGMCFYSLICLEILVGLLAKQ